jgi:hypothetical protein
MALEPEVRQAIRWVARAFGQFAADQGWKPGDYQVFVHINQDWGRVHVLLAATDFPGNTHLEKWQYVMDYLKRHFGKEEPLLLQALGLTLRTFDQIEEGGIYSIAPQFVDVRDYYVGGVANEV